MSDLAPENGYTKGRPGLPAGIVIAAVVIALVAVSALILLLYRETHGPGEILRQFARAVDDGDCTGSYDLLHPAVRREVDETEWCDVLPSIDEEIDADFDLEQAILQGDEAEVHVSGVEVKVWRLKRFGERSWRVVGPGNSFGGL
jgi:hypothetical protein